MPACPGQNHQKRNRAGYLERGDDEATPRLAPAKRQLEGNREDAKNLAGHVVDRSGEKEESAYRPGESWTG